MDDYHSPHHEAVMVRELCIAIDENRFTIFTPEEMCHLVKTYALYQYTKLHLYMMVCNVFYQSL